jgi:hypothetical protein
MEDFIYPPETKNPDAYQKKLINMATDWATKIAQRVAEEEGWKTPVLQRREELRLYYDCIFFFMEKKSEEEKRKYPWLIDELKFCEEEMLDLGMY